MNAYLPPRPTIERCYAFGQAVAHTVTAMGLETVVELVELTSALHAITHEPGARSQFIDNAAAYAGKF